jgi:hypothetical protein
MVFDQKVVPQFTTQVQVLRSDCSLSDSWQTENNGYVLATSPDQNLLAIANTTGPPSETAARQVIELVDTETHTAKQRLTFTGLVTYEGGFRFADHGKAVCTGFYPEGRREPDAACWDTKTGTKISENDHVSLDAIGIDGSGGDLLTIADHKFTYRQGKFWVFLDMNSDYSTAKRRLIWNFRTGHVVASWGPDGLYQSELWGSDQAKARKMRSRFVLSLSLAGKYLAEAGPGSVSLYSIRP